MSRLDQQPEIATGAVLRAAEALAQASPHEWVRVYGSLTQVDVRRERAVLDDGTGKVVVDTSLLGDVQPALRSMYMVIGQWQRPRRTQTDSGATGDGHDDENDSRAHILGRVWQCVDGLDMRLLWQAVDLRRQHLTAKRGV